MALWKLVLRFVSFSFHFSHLHPKSQIPFIQFMIVNNFFHKDFMKTYNFLWGANIFCFEDLKLYANGAHQSLSQYIIGYLLWEGIEIWTFLDKILCLCANLWCCEQFIMMGKILQKLCDKREFDQIHSEVINLQSHFSITRKE